MRSPEPKFVRVTGEIVMTETAEGLADPYDFPTSEEVTPTSEANLNQMRVQEYFTVHDWLELAVVDLLLDFLAQTHSIKSGNLVAQAVQVVVRKNLRHNLRGG